MHRLGIEIERRFKLLVPIATLSDDSALISQWYLPNTGSWTVRCRITTKGGNGIVSTYCQTLKRDTIELESAMTQEEFMVMRHNCHPIGVTKRRYHKTVDDMLWELDVFTDLRLYGLEIAEIELPHIDAPISIPDWIGTEVTGVRCLSNMSLSKFLNDPDIRQAAIDSVTSSLAINIDRFTTHTLKTRIVDLFKAYRTADNSNMIIHKIIVKEEGYGLLNGADINWLMSDQLTVLDLILMVAFIKRRLQKKK